MGSTRRDANFWRNNFHFKTTPCANDTGFAPDPVTLGQKLSERTIEIIGEFICFPQPACLPPRGRSIKSSMQKRLPISDELRRSPIATGKVSNLEVERLRRALRNAEVAFGHIPTNRNLRALNEAREALRKAGGMVT
jgi:hypothetical protein